ncbi:hypothetical protein [Micromonospora sp. CPCC 205561]|uniref:hypothetical protein n=1 Tax=Micromonospora sp. CPCC 205561 TaxID=3122407 RepID=UPI002FF41E6A
MGSVRGVLLGTVLLLAGCATADPSLDRADAPAGAATPQAAASPSAGCGSPVRTERLPDWARGGFSGEAVMPHVFGARGEIVAVLFGHPLGQGGAGRTNNKILWVPRPAATSPDPASPATLTITATLDGTATTVTREVAGGPGPSIVDLPSAGCWRLELRWSGRSDTMGLVYGDG